jgi:hypothetical protein
MLTHRRNETFTQHLMICSGAAGETRALDDGLMDAHGGGVDQDTPLASGAMKHEVSALRNNS